MRTIRFLLKKEFLQIVRNKAILIIMFQMPIIQLIILPQAASFEMKNIYLSVVDHDHSTYAQRLINKFISSKYFILTDYSTSYKAALTALEENKADLIIEIPPHFEKDLIKDSKAKLLISINAINGSKAGLAGGYSNGIINDFNNEIREKWVQFPRFMNVPRIEVLPLFRFNPTLNYKTYMVPGILVMLLTLIGGILSTINIVREKEIGTMEQINVTPVKKGQFILAKLIPFWLLGMIVLTIGLLIARFLYGIVPAGSLFTIYVFGAVYVLTFAGFGLLISTYAETQQQATFINFFFVMIFNIMSGLFTPISSMPQWAQVVTWFNPLAYLVDVMRLVVLKGSHFTDVIHQFLAICAFAVVFISWAMLNYRKTTA